MTVTTMSGARPARRRAPVSGASLVIDLRPLQGGDSGRGIGATVSGLARCMPGTEAVVWRDRPLPGEAEGRRLVPVPGPHRGERRGWVADAALSRLVLSRLRDVVWHLPTSDISYGACGSYVLTLHDTIPWRFPDLYPAGPTGRLRMSLTARMARKAAMVVVPSKVSADDARRFLEVPYDRLAVIPWAADPDLVTPVPEHRERLAQSLRLPITYVVMAGGFVHHDPRKHYPDAARALLELPEEVSLVVTGADGPASSRFREEVDRMGLSRRVTLTGFLDAAEMSAVFSRAAAFVFPSLWEGFGLPLLNAFALGVPAVVSDGGSLPEVAGGAALVYPAGDTVALARELARVLESPDLAAELAERGRDRGSQFSWTETADRYRQVYRDAGAAL